MNISDIVGLSDQKEYVVASKVKHDNKTYLCLVEIRNNKNIKYCYLDQDEVVILKKEELSKVLILKLIRQTMKFDFQKLLKEAEENN